MRKLTCDEEADLDHMRKAWDGFINLDKLHPEEFQEFRYKMHDLQRMVAAHPFLRINHDT